MSEKIGLTRHMLGIDAVIADALTPYKLLVQRLQTRHKPVAHHVRKWTCEMFFTLNNMFLADPPNYGRYFTKWMKGPAREDTDLINQVKAIGKKFVFDFLTNVRFRFQPYWRAILAFETANPCQPYRTSPSAWLGVKDLCRRCIPDAAPAAVVKDLQDQKHHADNFNLAQINICNANVLNYYRQRKVTQARMRTKIKFPLAEKFALLVFCVHVVSSNVETYFSKNNYAKNKYRTAMRLDLLSSTLHLQVTNTHNTTQTIHTTHNTYPI